MFLRLIATAMYIYIFCTMRWNKNIVFAGQEYNKRNLPMQPHESQSYGSLRCTFMLGLIRTKVRNHLANFKHGYSIAL